MVVVFMSGLRRIQVRRSSRIVVHKTWITSRLAERASRHLPWLHSRNLRNVPTLTPERFTPTGIKPLTRKTLGSAMNPSIDFSKTRRRSSQGGGLPQTQYTSTRIHELPSAAISTPCRNSLALISGSPLSAANPGTSSDKPSSNTIVFSANELTVRGLFSFS
jgi:hypothetical protein